MQVELWADSYPMTISECYIIQPVYKIEGKSYLGEKELGKAIFYESAIKVEE